jgi:hypothetical protein
VNPMELTCMSEEYGERVNRVVEQVKQSALYLGLQHHLLLLTSDPFFHTSEALVFHMKNILKAEADKAFDELTRIKNLEPFPYRTRVMGGSMGDPTIFPRMSERTTFTRVPERPM